MTAPLSNIGELDRRHQSAKQRPERPRDVLFGAGCGLLCFGLFPFSATASSSASSHNSNSSGDGDGALLADEFDPMTRALSLTFSLVGLACVTLSCVVVARAKLRAALVVLLLPLMAAIGMSGVAIWCAATADDLVNVLRNTRVVSFDQELRLERAVNERYCVAQMQSLCQCSDVDATRGKSVFGLDTWKELDAACTTLQHEPVTNNDGDIDPLTLIAEPSSEATHWCGAYMATSNHEDAVDLTKSPYQQHRVEVLDQLLRALTRRQARMKLLMVLVWFATPALLAALWWLRVPSSKIGAVASSTVRVIV